MEATKKTESIENTERIMATNDPISEKIANIALLVLQKVWVAVEWILGLFG